MLFKLEFEQSTKYPSLSHLHSSKHAIASVVSWIINHIQNITAGVANSSNTNITVSLDDMAIFLDLHSERK
jgi:hypothetical protein